MESRDDPQVTDEVGIPAKLLRAKSALLDESKLSPPGWSPHRLLYLDGIDDGQVPVVVARIPVARGVVGEHSRLAGLELADPKLVVHYPLKRRLGVLPLP